GKRLQEARPSLESLLPALGRINIRNHPSLDWVGTGWLVADDVIVTNRHVVEEFCQPSGSLWAFRRNPETGLRRASIDFTCEFQVDEETEFAITEATYVEAAEGPDLGL